MKNKHQLKEFMRERLKYYNKETKHGLTEEIKLRAAGAVRMLKEISDFINEKDK